jgi:hypothetical protein
MKNARLVIVAMLAMGAFQSAGCFFTTDDSDDDVVDAVRFRMTWSFTDANGPTDCLAHNGDTVNFVFTRDTDNMLFAEPFNCEDMMGTTAPLTLGAYHYVPTLTFSDGSPNVMTDDAIPINSDVCDSLEGSNCIVNQDFNFNL